MTKTDLINDIAFEMSNILTPEQIDKVKIVFLVKMQDFELAEIKQLPMIEEHDNEWLMKRYWIDGAAVGLKESTMRGYLGRIKEFFDFTGKNYKYITEQDITDTVIILARIINLRYIGISARLSAGLSEKSISLIILQTEWTRLSKSRHRKSG